MSLHRCLFGLVLLLLSTGVGCDSSPMENGSKKVSSAPDAALTAPVSSIARIENDEGVTHYQQGHWDVAMEHFHKAIQADPDSAVAYYNAGLTQDKMGNHQEATTSFKKALELAPDDPRIKDSEILQKHLG